MHINFHIYSFSAPDFIDAQRTSFIRLLKSGIPAELEKHNPVDLYIEKGFPEWFQRFQTPLINQKWLPNSTKVDQSSKQNIKS